MSRGGDRVASIEIKVAIAIARVDPNALTALCDDRHFLVSRELVSLFE